MVCLFCSPHPRLSIVLTPWLWKEEVPPALLGSLLQLQHTHLCTCSDGVYEGGFLFWFVPSVLPPPSSPLGFSRILFWNWRRKRKSKKKKKKRVSESEKGKQRWNHNNCSLCPQTRDLTSLQRYTSLPPIIPLFPSLLPSSSPAWRPYKPAGRLSRPGHSFFPTVTHSPSFRMSRFWILDLLLDFLLEWQNSVKQSRSKLKAQPLSTLSTTRLHCIFASWVASNDCKQEGLW